MDSAVLDELLQRHRELSKFLHGHGEISLALDAELLFKRAFVVAAGSHCEGQLCAVLERFAAKHGDSRLAFFVKTRALERRYHDLFDWKAMNVNRFWSFFGEEFKEHAIAHLRARNDATTWMRSFVELGQLRNLTAHAFATASVDRTLVELESMLRNALQFLGLVEDLLDDSSAKVP